MRVSVGATQSVSIAEMAQIRVKGEAMEEAKEENPGHQRRMVRVEEMPPRHHPYPRFVSVTYASSDAGAASALGLSTGGVVLPLGSSFLGRSGAFEYVYPVYA